MYLKYMVLAAGILVVSGCKDQAEVEDGEVLATVDGSPITRVDLDVILVKTIGYSKALQIDKAGEKKFLESLVVSRAMSKAIINELSEEQLLKVERETNAYREQLLVKKYLNRYALPQSVTEKSIKTYYDANPELFGGGVRRRYEMIFVNNPPKGDRRQSLIQEMNSIKDDADWQSIVADLLNKGWSLQYRTGLGDSNVLHPRLRNLVNSLKINKTSKLTFVEGKPYLVRVISEQQQISRSLADVSADIRKVLVLEEFRKATKIATNEILKKVSVEYIADE